MPLLITSVIWAASPGDVVINELMWMGSDPNEGGSTADEWIELRNMTGSSIDLDGWVLEKAATSGGNLTIPNGNSIPANGYFLIANYSESSGSSNLNVTPDWVTTAVSLFLSSLCNLVTQQVISET